MNGSVTLGLRTEIGAGFVTLLLVVSVLLVAPRVGAEIPQNPRAAEDAVYPCPAATGASQRLAQARALATQTHDRNKLACAADLYYTLVLGGTTDPALLLAALEAHNSYLAQVGIERDLDFIGVQTLEWNARLAKAGKQLGQISELAAKAYPEDPAIAVERAQADLLVHHYDDPKDFVAATKRAIPVLDRVIASAPAVLDGRALVYLGKLYLDLPTIFGGNSARAVELLAQARALAPRDSERLADLALAYDEVDRPEDVRTVLRDLLALSPSGHDLQALADAWMVGQGLAERLSDDSLRRGFETKRHGLLATHRDLMTRARTAVGGHGGEDPLTGKRQY